MFNVNNKNILITGATSGIGKESALALAKMGANITFIARNKAKAKNLLNDINKISSGHNSFIIADLSSQKDIKAASKNNVRDSFLDRLVLNELRIDNMIDGIEKIILIIEKYIYKQIEI